MRWSASQPRGGTEKNVRPQATWFQARHARWRSTSQWCKEARLGSGGSGAGERPENVASPATAAIEAVWVLGASRCTAMSRIILARHGGMVGRLCLPGAYA